MSKSFLGGLLLIVAAAVFILYNALFTVHQTQQALVLQFGETKRQISEPGLAWKIPFVQNVVFFDRRILDLDSPAQEVIAADQKRLVVDAFARYRIENSLRFYQSVGTVGIANSRLSTLLNSAVRRVLGEASFTAVVRDDRPDLMLRIRQQMDDEAEKFGIDIVDVRIRRADLPEANSQAIYSRMQTARQREAAEIRAEGEEAARRIRSRADRTATVIIAEANRESEELRGDGDAARANIFAEAYGKDPEFFSFYRSMQAYEAGIASGDTRMVLSPKSEFFRYFGNSAGKGLPTPPAAPAQ
ncbi:MAG: protease modulator HflC [Rhodobiaceae bacterium]|nr:protease modulator HflC [Rhodobiaceae bacterium]MCC0012043.1 protease modulator HflC [Rhodobiaceae bacterium]MCC0051510.1 protease modulator HflC [Rhodobiaceae bacterium]MCC0061041.1 protease modulator HflC [Rhodobiaceae bacterium]